MDAALSFPQPFSFQGLIVPAVPSEAHDFKRSLPREDNPMTITRVLHTEGLADRSGRTAVIGDQLLRFEHPESGALLEVWMRRTGQNENLRIIVLSDEAGQPQGRYWDLGPALRRDLGGAIVPYGNTEEVVGIGGRQYRAMVEARSGGLSTFTLESVQDPTQSGGGLFGKRRSTEAAPERLKFAIVEPSDNTPCSLTASAEGWKSVENEPTADAGRLFKMVEQWRKQVLKIPD